MCAVRLPDLVTKKQMKGFVTTKSEDGMAYLLYIYYCLWSMVMLIKLFDFRNVHRAEMESGEIDVNGVANFCQVQNHLLSVCPRLCQGNSHRLDTYRDC